MDHTSQQLEIRLREGENCTYLSLRGELDVASAGAFMEQLSLVNQSGVAELTVDLSELSYIDPTGLSVLAVERRRAAASGMTLHIASPSDFVRRMLCITGLIDFLDVLPISDEGMGTAKDKDKDKGVATGTAKGMATGMAHAPGPDSGSEKQPGTESESPGRPSGP
jgi:anti-anti-sigma factor